jgi:hypothetical protein
VPTPGTRSMPVICVEPGGGDSARVGNRLEGILLSKVEKGQVGELHPPPNLAFVILVCLAEFCRHLLLLVRDVPVIDDHGKYQRYMGFRLWLNHPLVTSVPGSSKGLTVVLT